MIRRLYAVLESRWELLTLSCEAIEELKVQSSSLPIVVDDDSFGVHSKPFHCCEVACVMQSGRSMLLGKI